MRCGGLRYWRTAGRYEAEKPEWLSFRVVAITVHPRVHFGEHEQREWHKNGPEQSGTSRSEYCKQQGGNAKAGENSA